MVSRWALAEDSPQPDKPIWSTMKPAEGTTEPGFAPPPPQKTVTNKSLAEPDKAKDQVKPKLTARIEADTLTVQQGQSITFTLQSNESDVRYYWISGNQKGNKKSFVVNTSALEPGKHRVRATATNRQRQQAHAAIFFNVLKPENLSPSASASASPTSTTGTPADNAANSENAENTHKPNNKSPDQLIELPPATNDASSVDTTAESSTSESTSQLPNADNDSAADRKENNDGDSANNGDNGDKKEQDEAGKTESDNTDQNDTPDSQNSAPTDTSSSDENQTDDAGASDTESLKILPSTLTIVPGDDAVFTSSFKTADGNQLHWKFTDKRGDNDSFTVSSANFEPGTYAVHLSAIDKTGAQHKAQATLIIVADKPALAIVPSLSGLDVDKAKELLQQNSLVMGQITEQETEHGDGKILGQTPQSGTQVSKGEAVNITVAVPSRIVKMPGVLGNRLAEARAALSKAGLTTGQVTETVDNNAIGLVLQQSIPAGTELKRGSRIDLVVGKAAPKPLTVSINPVSTVIESGKTASFDAIIVDPEVDNNLTYQWAIDNNPAKNGSSKTLLIATSDLSEGEHAIDLTVTDSSERTAQSTATISVTPQTAVIPDVHGMSLQVAQEILEKAGYKVSASRQPSTDVSIEEVRGQVPEAGQKATPGTIIKLNVATPQAKPSMTLSLSVDQSEIKLGESVTFKSSLSPQPLNNETHDDIHYVYSINAEKKANVQPELTWTPEKEGIYSIAVTAFDKSGILAKSDPVTVTVSPKWVAPVAKIVPEMQIIQQGDRAEFISTSTYDLNSRLSYDWVSDTSHSGSKKKFAFNTADTAPGSYNVRLKVTDQKGNTSEASAMLVVQAEVGATDPAATGADGTGLAGAGTGQTANNGSDHSGTTPGSARSNSSGTGTDTGEDIRIHLSASRKFAKTGQTLQIKATSNKPLENAYYYFEPGDGKNTQWLTSNVLNHTYSDFGTYLVRAAVKVDDKVYYSDSTTIWVWSPLLLLFTAGFGLLAYLLMWWWTKRIPVSEKPIDTPPASEPVIAEEQIPLRSDNEDDENDIVTEPRLDDKPRTVASVLKRALIQFVLGLVISALVIYVILKSTNLL